MSLILYIIGKMMRSHSEEVIDPGPSEPEIIGEFINESFPGSDLGGWDAGEGAQTITVAGGEVNLVGSGSTKDVTKRLIHTSYGLSTLRNYVLEMEFKINSIGANTKGIYLGVESNTNSGFLLSTYGLLDFSTSTGPRLQIAGCDNADIIQANPQETTTGLPPINTTDSYKLTLTMNEATVTVDLLNVTTSQTRQLVHTYNFSPYGVPFRPNIFHYAFGIAGSSDVSVQSFKASTTELRYPKMVFVGDSITVGYSADSPLNSYAYKLRPFTDDDIQIMAGGANAIIDAIDNLYEILYISPQIVFLNIGTNGGTFAQYQSLVSALEAEGKEVIPLLIVNGGNPATSGTFNNLIAVTYATKYIDIWTSGWNIMNVGNGEMADALHPTNIGGTRLANLIKAARLDLFPV